VAGIPAELEGLVAALLAKRPSDRPQSAAAAAAALRSMLRTYRAAEDVPDTQGEELAGALTPLLRAEYMVPAIPGRAPILTHSQVSGDAPTAGVSHTGAVPFGYDGRSHTPAFAVRGSSPQAPISSGGRSWVVGGPMSAAPSTRTAPPPEPMRSQAEPTPSGVSRTAPGPYQDSFVAHPEHPRSKRWIGIAALVVVGSGTAGWVLTQPKVPADVAPAASLVLPAALPSAAPIATAPQASPVGGATIGGSSAPATVAATAAEGKREVDAPSEREPTTRRGTRPRTRVSQPEDDYHSIQVIPVETRPAPRPASVPTPLPSPSPAASPAPAPTPKQVGRGMPGSGIGAGG
jgi:hypothetical protein